MIKLSGFQIIEEIHNGNFSIVYKGIRDNDNKPVFLKILKKELCNPERIARFKMEYELTKSIHEEGVIKALSFEKLENTYVIVLEDIGAESLGKIIKFYKIKIDEFLVIAIRITEILGQLHKENIIHKDINPSNIVYNQTTKEIKIIDFDIATKLSRENQEIRNPDKLEGTLPYISPEQTGRMNRSIDYRSDYYSLGLTFYELLSGVLPFTSNDPMELVHCHIAKEATPLCQLNVEGRVSRIPIVISNIVDKLISKSPEMRYQSAEGIIHDLNWCLQSERKLKTVSVKHDSPFQIGTHDYSNIFQIPEKLYGREKEIENLLEIFDTIKKGSTELALVSGYSGSGKSTLVNELLKPIELGKGFFIHGKYEKFGFDVPYNGISNALKDLVQQLLLEQDSIVNHWKEKIINAIQPNGQAVINIIPDLEKLIGKQNSLDSIGPAEERNRFLFTFEKFIKVFTENGNPLVLFLDDLQWCDIPSLTLIKKLLLSFEINHLFIIGTYRENEVDNGHPLMLTLDEIQKEKKVNKLVIHPLSLSTINQLVSETLHCELDRSLALSEIIYNKTEGNPFFTKELMMNLYWDRYLFFNHENKIWDWSIDKIRQSKVSDNVLDLLEIRLRNLNEKTQVLLSLAACVGSVFDFKTLAIINEGSFQDTASSLWDAVESGVIIPLTSNYRLVNAIDSNSEKDFSDTNITFNFQHDRVHQSAYSIIDDNRKKQIHLKIGNLLLRTMNPELQPEKLIEMIHHLNIGITFIVDKKEKDKLKNYNLIAGKKAKSSSAYEPALQYLTIAKDLLDTDSWKTEYSLTFEIYKSYAQACFLCGKVELAEDSCKVLLRNARSNLEKAEIKEMQSIHYNFLWKINESIQAGIQGLHFLGINISDKPSILAIVIGLIKVKWLLRKKSIEDLFNQPNITDPKIKLCLKLLINFIPPAYLSGNGNLFAVAILTKTYLAIKYGNSSETAAAYTGYATLLAGLGDLKNSYKFGKLGISISEKNDSLEWKCMTYDLYTLFSVSWNEDWRNLSELYKKALEIGLRSGDLLYTAFSANFITLWDPEMDLGLQFQERKKYIQLIEKTKIQTALLGAKIAQIRLLSFQNIPITKDSINDPSYNGDEYLQSLTKINYVSGIAQYHIYKTQIYYFKEDYQSAVMEVKETDKTIKSLAGSPFLVEYCMFAFLSYVAVYEDLPLIQKFSTKRKFYKYYKTMKKWTEHNPNTFSHYYFLMKAEIARITKDYVTAANYYNKAIEAAKNLNFIQFIALYNELAAKFYLSNSEKAVSFLFLKNAHSYYLHWGATVKVMSLRKRYPELITKEHTDSHSTIKGSITTSTQLESVLDLRSIVKSSQVISGEVVLKNLLQNLIKILIENAGANRGLLLLEKNKGKKDLVIQAEGYSNDQEPVVLQSIPLEAYTTLPKSVIQYVIRTGQNVVLDDAGKSGLFTKDSYIAEHKVKSILCAPILYQNIFIGIIYLENNLATGAFTEQRIEILKVLSAQAAISIENSLLYANLEEKVVERTNQLEEAHKKILLLEKENTEKQLAGGFAHEMRNALVGPKLVIQHVLGQDGIEPFESLNLINNRKLKEIYLLIQNKVPADTLQNSLKAMKVIFENEEQIDNSLNMIYKSVSKGLSITQTIMDYAKVGNEQSGRILIDLNSLIKSIVEEYRNEWSVYSISMQLDLTNELSQIHGLENHFDSVFKNIILNAKDALLDKNSDNRKNLLDIKTEVMDNHFIATITDNGSGIAPENLHRIYDAFFSTKPDSGTGLGLGIVKKILTLYNGKIDVVSELGKGTSFIVSIPLEIEK